MTESEIFELCDRLREQGWMICVWTPDETCELDEEYQRDLEGQIIAYGNELIDES